MTDGDDEFTGHDEEAPTFVTTVFDENVAFAHVSSKPFQVPFFVWVT